jgi:two-component system phosphate regulon sensor histidine kinase PhoR
VPSRARGPSGSADRKGRRLTKLWGRPVAGVMVVSIVALLLWPVLGTFRALIAYCALLLLLLAHHIVHLSQLYRWFAAATSQTIPEGSGAWEEVFAGLARLMRRQTHIESRLSAALTRFQQAGAALPEGIVVLDEADRIVWCNPRAEGYFGLDSQRDRGQQVTYLIRQPQFVQYLEAGRFSEPLAMRVTRTDAELSLSIQLVPYGDRDKLLLSRDVTRWERLETTRRDFVANVSHELRTPLTVLNGFLETLADMPEADPEMSRRSIVLMLEQTTRMHRLVEDLLTLSRLESSHTPLREESVDIRELASTLHRESQALSAGRHRIMLRIESENGLLGSGEELRSAFGNLISNAVRYTPEGGEIEILWTQRDDLPVFAVRDTGIGVEPHHIPRLTERFYRVDRSRSRSTGGTGLGLAIVKHVLSRHQATLEIESELSRGSTFSAVFPRVRALVQPSSDQTAAAKHPLRAAQG